MQQTQAQTLKEISLFLAQNRIPYMITGAWSAIFYGRPRASHDIDFVVEIHKKNLDKVESAFNRLPGDFLVQSESILDAVNQKSMFQIMHLPTMLKLDFWILTEKEFDKSRFKRRKKVRVLGQFMDMATAEDTILQKLIWYGMGKIEKHLIDAAFVYQIQKKKLDIKYLNFWVTKLRVEKYYRQLEEIDLEQHL